MQTSRLKMLATEILTAAQAGITYCKNEYDLERYEQLKDIAAELMALATGNNLPDIERVLLPEHGYLTPKVDVRGVVFKDGKILMVQEKSDGKWTLPGGWADWGYTPSQIAEKEVREEAGLDVKAEKLLAVFDKARHEHPADIYTIYKIFILCRLVSGAAHPGTETLDARFFGRDEIPELSAGRTTERQLSEMFNFLDNPEQPALFD